MSDRVLQTACHYVPGCSDSGAQPIRKCFGYIKGRRYTFVFVFNQLFSVY